MNTQQKFLANTTNVSAQNNKCTYQTSKQASSSVNEFLANTTNVSAQNNKCTYQTSEQASSSVNEILANTFITPTKQASSSVKQPFAPRKMTRMSSIFTALQSLSDDESETVINEPATASRVEITLTFEDAIDENFESVSTKRSKKEKSRVKSIASVNCVQQNDEKLSASSCVLNELDTIPLETFVAIGAELLEDGLKACSISESTQGEQKEVLVAELVQESAPKKNRDSANLTIATGNLLVLAIEQKLTETDDLSSILIAIPITPCETGFKHNAALKNAGLLKQLSARIQFLLKPNQQTKFVINDEAMTLIVLFKVKEESTASVASAVEVIMPEQNEFASFPDQATIEKKLQTATAKLNRDIAKGNQKAIGLVPSFLMISTESKDTIIRWAKSVGRKVAIKETQFSREVRVFQCDKADWSKI